MRIRTLDFLLLSWCALGIESFSASRRIIFRGNIAVRKANPTSSDHDDEDFDMEVFKSRLQNVEPKREFDGYALRDLILEKWGECYDADFNRVDSFGFRQIYLNVYPFKMGGRGKWRHETELDYLMHLQAIVEILERYGQLDSVIYQIQETNKKPKMGAPIKAVPIRLDLTDEQISKIMGY
jgi:hypothetical protein